MIQGARLGLGRKKLGAGQDSELPQSKSKVNGKGNGQHQDILAAAARKYDPKDWIVPGQDHNGNSVREWFRCQPTMDREIEVILTARKFPFRVKGDLLRWAVWEGIKKLNRMEDIPTSMFNVAEIMIKTSREAEMWHKFRTSIEVTKKAVQDYVDTGNEEEALKLLSAIKAEVIKIEEDVWRRNYLEALEKEFGHIWERNKKRAAKLGLG